MRAAFSQTLPARVARMSVLSRPKLLAMIFNVVAVFLSNKLKARLRLITDAHELAEIADPAAVLACIGLGGTLEWS